MTKLEAVVRPETVQELRSQLLDLGAAGMTFAKVRACGERPGQVLQFLGAAYETHGVPMTKVELVLPTPMVEEAIRTIRNACYTGEQGDGLIYIMSVHDAVRIRTGVHGNEAL